MVLKVIVIGPNVLGISELIENGKFGFMVSPDDIDTLVEKIRILLMDENLRKCFVEDGYEKVIKEFNLKIETNKLLQVLNK